MRPEVITHPGWGGGGGSGNQPCGCGPDTVGMACACPQGQTCIRVPIPFGFGYQCVQGVAPPQPATASAAQMVTKMRQARRSMADRDLPWAHR